jgi:hypothetical protein
MVLPLVAPCSTAEPFQWKEITGGRVTKLAPIAPASAGFQRMENTGIHFTNSLPPGKLLENQIRLNGCGVAAGDIDGDGLCDLFFCSLEGRSHLYKNLGNWQFMEITDQAGVSCSGLYTSGAAFADVDGDGSLDLLVNAYGSGTRLFLNDGHGHFTEKPNAGLVRHYGSSSLTLADIDGNGTLDLYVVNYATTTMADHPNAKLTFKNISGKPTLLAIDGVPIGNDPDMQNRYIVDPLDGKLKQAGEPDILYLNKGNGIFEAQPWSDGRFLDENGKALTSAPFDWGLSAMFRDINGDGFPDLYVCNDLFSPDRVWLNDGSGHFRAAPNFAIRHTSHSSMGIDFADINRDGVDDFLVLDMLSSKSWLRKLHVVGLHQETFPPGRINNRPQCDQNTLFLGRGDGTFAEVSQLAGLDASGWSWLPVFLDVDLDGYEDVLITTGYFRDSLNADLTAQFARMKSGKNLTGHEILELQRQVFPRNPLPKVAFRNRGDLTFEDASDSWRFNDVGISQGMCLADLDNDGDLDVIVNNFDAPPTLYRNETSAPRVAVRLKGLSPNTRGIGAKISFLGGPVPQSQQMVCGGRYLSSDDNERVFAAGTNKGPFSIEVSWRSARFSLITNVQANCLYEIDEAQAGSAQKPNLPSEHTLFRDVSELIRHAHSETPFDDFANQPLLPRKLSEAGPAVAWADVDGDGWPDLLISGGRGGSLAVIMNDGKGHFRPGVVPPALRDLKTEQASVLGIPTDHGGLILAAQSNYELPTTNSVILARSDASGLTVDAGLPATPSCPGPMALADVDGDGYLDLLVGGRLVRGSYPAPASSQLFKGSATGSFAADPQANELLKSIGLVNGAVFSDLDGDGWPDLIIAVGWGPLRVFHNSKGRFHEITEKVGLGKFTGWWNGVTTGDFDGDGRMDIVASNWGRNSKYERYRCKPLEIYYGDWNGQGTIELLEAYVDPELRKTVPVKGFDAVRRGLPWVQARFTNYESYGRASIEEVLGDRFPPSAKLEANTLESMVFLNRGDHFEARPLPIEAQFAPAFGICAADLDGDGNEDIFLAQNFYGVDHETSRYDAGGGLWLRGDGHGGFTSVPGQTSGIQVYGDQRGAAVCDYDADGRVDLAVSQNGTITKLYHNEGAKPGLRVTLAGGPGNPTGIGAQVRLVYASSAGPVREVHCGSGYWSQDGATQVLGQKERPLKLWVRWPGGSEVTYPLPQTAKDVTVDSSGHLQVK